MTKAFQLSGRCRSISCGNIFAHFRPFLPISHHSVYISTLISSHTRSRSLPIPHFNMNNSLQQTALDVIAYLRMIPRWTGSNIAVIGGVARLHYKPGGRHTSVSEGQLHRLASVCIESYTAYRMWTSWLNTLGRTHSPYRKPSMRTSWLTSALPFTRILADSATRKAAPNGGEPVSHRISFYGPTIVRPFCTDSIPLCPAFCLYRPFLNTASP